jgi:hypothetical protein
MKRISLRGLLPRVVVILSLFLSPLAAGSAPDAADAKPGRVLFIQIDGLSRPHLQRALDEGRMPAVSRLLAEGGYRLYSLYSGLPSTTAAMLAEFLYGVKTAVPGYGFQKTDEEKILRMSDLRAARTVEARLETKGRPLLKGGSAYSVIYTGGADESYFCGSAVREGWDKALFFARWYVALIARYPGQSLWGMALTVWEFVPATLAAVHGATLLGMRPRQELYFIFLRVALSVGLREVVSLGARRDMERGVPAVLVNFLGYDEASHRRGPSSEYAMRFLKAIDGKIGRLIRVAKKNGYTVYIYSDHGQEDVKPYPDVGGEPLKDVVRSLAEKYLPRDDASPFDVVFVPLEEWARESLGIGDNVLKESDLALVAMGPVAHLYLPAAMDSEKIGDLARDLVRAGVPAALAAEGDGRAVAFTAEGALTLPDDIERMAGDHPFRERIVRDLIELCRHPDAGRLILTGWAHGRKPLSLASENGAHGGFGPTETHAFALFPPGASEPDGESLRPVDLRNEAFRVREAGAF